MLVASLLVVALSINNETVVREQMENRYRVERVERNELQETKEELRERFRTRLGEIKDERKQRVVMKISDDLVMRNLKWTRHLSSALTRLSDILTKLETRANRIKLEKNADISAVTTAIADARAMISSLQGKIDMQAEAEYVIELGSEETLGQKVSEKISELREDIGLLHEEVMKIKVAVQDVYQLLARIMGNTNVEE
ncbi:hypothetical protein A2191_02570 [Candidatus Woesebacteria bacterium RIFOXYA1_FULL_38_9]|nr:MAG: hypothetical protein A2191_02570 [Candidatus Woesebacteria bacterium RIFOXYA1_FULL_38_9]